MFLTPQGEGKGQAAGLSHFREYQSVPPSLDGLISRYASKSLSCSLCILEKGDVRNFGSRELAKKDLTAVRALDNHTFFNLSLRDTADACRALIIHALSEVCEPKDSIVSEIQ